MVFVNREEEIKELEQVVSSRDNAFIISLRGYGKTALLKEFNRRMSQKRVKGVYINCLRIYSGSDLLELFGEGLKKLIELGFIKYEDLKDLELRKSSIETTKYALELLFEFGSEHLNFIILDEISTLLSRFGLKKPYRGLGGSKAVMEHIKGLLDTYDITLIASDTSLNSLFSLARDYSAPLFKEMRRVLFLSPLSMTHSIELIREELKVRGVSLSEDSIARIAELTYGVPQYIKMFLGLVRSGMTPEEVEEAFYQDMRSGSFNAYFKLLFEKFSSTEQEVLVFLSRKISRGSEIIRRIPGAYTILDILCRKGIVRKIVKSERESHYLITDKLLEAWLQLQDIGQFKKISERRVKLLSFGFESIVREALLGLNKSIELDDSLGRKIVITPYRKVTRYESALGEIDALAYLSKTAVDVYEITIEKADTEKVKQLMSKIAIAESTGLSVERGILIAYQGFKKEALKFAESLVKAGSKIYLIEGSEVKKLVKESGMRMP